MSKLKLELKEPYPIYRSLRVPIWENENAIITRKVTQKDVEDLATALGILKDILSEVIKSPLTKELDICDKLECIANTIVLFYKAPLIQEVSPVAPTPLKAYSMIMLFGKLLSKVILKEHELSEIIKDPFKLAEVLGSKEFIKILRESPLSRLFERNTADLVYKLWISFPADTRPGYNTSSLIVHLLLTSAITWALNYDLRRSDRCYLNILRIASLLHDIGKAVDPEDHVNKSVDIAKTLLRDVVSDELLSKILELIERHHERNSPLHRADVISSESDRLTSLVGSVIGDKLDKLERIIGKSRDEWEFYRDLYIKIEDLKKLGILKTDDPVKELSEEFLEGIKAKKIIISKSVKHSVISDINVVLIDVASIQDFIYRAQEIKTMALASHIVDLITYVSLYFYIYSMTGIPPETIVYSGGGNVLLLLPRSINIDELIDNFNNELKKNAMPISLNYAKTNFTHDYVELSKNLGVDLAKSKFIIMPEESIENIVRSLHVKKRADEELCRLCYSDIALDKIKTPEGIIPVCQLCKRLYELGVNIHFAAKWSTTFNIADQMFSANEAFNKTWDEISPWIMEIIAGHNPEELDTGIQKLRDYAVVKFDGNNIGSFMLDAISFTDAVERSFRIDYAIKKAYFKALELIFESIKEVNKNAAIRDVIRIFLGTIYMGGDDGLLIVPAYLAVPLAHLITEEFSRELGGTAGLTASITGGHAKMNIWALIDSANSLMEKAKEHLRAIGGGIIFDLYEGLAPSGHEAVKRISGVSSKFRGTSSKSTIVESAQPYEVKLDEIVMKKPPEMWRTLIPLIFDISNEDVEKSEWSRESSYKFYKEIFKKCFLASRSEDERSRIQISDQMVSYLKSLNRAILDSVREVSEYIYRKELLYIYVARQIKDAANKKVKPFYKLQKFFDKILFDTSGKFKESESTRLYDILILIKFVKGGAW